MVLKKKADGGCDQIVTSGILLLVVLTPLALGAVHPWAFMAMEVIIFFLIAVWMLKLALGRLARYPFPFFSKGTRSFTLPFLCFIGFAIFQLLPLPSAWLRTLSPATYTLYVRSLAGWPDTLPYEGWLSSDSGEIHNRRHLQSQNSIPQTQDLPPSSKISRKGPQLPLSIAPELSKTNLLKILAYAGLFFLVLLYPFGEGETRDESEERFYRTVLRVTFYTGGFIAFLGVAQRFTWNGKILWFFIPYDWPGPLFMDSPRASGPFVNPDHFANYLAMLLPVALVGFVSRSTFIDRSTHIALRVLFGLSVILLLMGLLLSLSRSGWLGAAVGIVSLLFLLPAERRQQLLGIGTQMTARFFFSVLVGYLVVALYLVGPAGRSQIDQRLGQSVMQTTDFWSRVELWQDSLKVVQDFPLFGVGLGAWPEVFPHYQRPPWSSFTREAHNDYVQGLAELGTLGFGLLVWFFAAVGLHLYRGLTNLSMKSALIYAALLASLNVMVLHECFDFNLQIPANAFLFTLFLALALRVAMKAQEHHLSENAVGAFPRFAPIGAMGTAALLLSVFALRQDAVPYPYNLNDPASLVEARESLVSYPAHASTHVSVFDLTEERMPIVQRLAALERALWLSPLDPSARDLYAQGLLQIGKEQEGLQEIAQSVFLSPSLSTHEDLTEERIAALDEKEQQALESGLEKALAAGWEEAASALGSFYKALGRYAEAGKVYEDAALKEEEDRLTSRNFLSGGMAFAQAGELTKAETLFRQAMLIDPRDSRPYQELMTKVCAAREELLCAKAVVTEGMQNGAAPVDLLLALADAARKMGEREAAKAALTEALRRRSSSFEALVALGGMYLQEKNFGRAASVLQKAVTVRPDEASTFYSLALAEEGRYRFAAAQKAYLQAVNLKPQDTDIRQRYEEFQRKVVESQ